MKDPDVEAHLWKQRFGELWEALNKAQENGCPQVLPSSQNEKFEEWYLEL